MNPMMMWDVMRFELRRSFTVSRISIWLMLVAFPVAIVAMIRSLDPDQGEVEWGIRLYFLLPEVVCLLGLLLWATPVISTEIEGQTWIYLAMRRSGRSIVLLGKYLTAVVWTTSAVWLATLICIGLLGSYGGFWFLLVMLGLVAISCLVHAALYVAIGTIFYKRTMVTAVMYTLLVEYGVSQVPAVANKLTVNYRLRGLLAETMGWDQLRTTAEIYLGTESLSSHLLVLLLMTLGFLGIALLRASHSEFPSQQEG